MLEGMALGVVPVVLDVGDLKDFVLDSITGYILKEGEVKKLPEYLERLLKDEALLKKLSYNARAKVVDLCDRKQLSLRWYDVLNELT